MQGVLILEAVLLLMVYLYYYAGGVHYEDRALSRTSALAFLLCGVVAVAALMGVIS